MTAQLRQRAIELVDQLPQEMLSEAVGILESLRLKAEEPKGVSVEESQPKPGNLWEAIVQWRSTINWDEWDDEDPWADVRDSPAETLRERSAGREFSWDE